MSTVSGARNQHQFLFASLWFHAQIVLAVDLSNLGVVFPPLLSEELFTSWLLFSIPH